MHKKAIISVLTGTMMSIAGVASAAEPMQLSEAQMDSVSAGVQQSVATGSASAVLGTAFAGARTAAFASGPVRITTASALGVALGVGAGATTSAGSSF